MARTLAGGGLLRHLQALHQEGAVGARSDAELLERFVSRRGEEAFAALVERHGPMVRGVCRAVLRDPHDADDAAQAAFLVLARRAHAIRHRDSVASWLFGVARRVATRAKVEAARRRRHERLFAEMRATHGDEVPDRTGNELYTELGRLPEAYRAPIVLCHLEGLSQEQAAHHLRLSLRTTQRRLEQGRARLRARLVRRGVVTAGGLPGASAPGTIRAAVPAAWAEATARAASPFAASRAAAAGSVSAAAALAEGVLKTMFLTRLKVLAALVAACSVAVGAGVQTRGDRGGGPAGGVPTGPVAPVAQAKPDGKSSAEARELANDDGKPAGKKSIAGSGHAVRFEAPGEGWSVAAVRVHGSRYGYPKPPDEDFKVYLCDAKFEVIAEFEFPYATFERGRASWHDLKVKPTKVPKTFIVCVGFDPAQTKGVYVSHDGEGSGASSSGLPGGKPRPFAQGDWLIRVRVTPPDAAGAPTGG
jgi:RNA polymerase sigma-70 factor (ECF subfamily)